MKYVCDQRIKIYIFSVWCTLYTYVEKVTVILILNAICASGSSCSYSVNLEANVLVWVMVFFNEAQLLEAINKSISAVSLHDFLNDNVLRDATWCLVLIFLFLFFWYIYSQWKFIIQIALSLYLHWQFIDVCCRYIGWKRPFVRIRIFCSVSFARDPPVKEMTGWITKWKIYYLFNLRFTIKW